MKLFHGIITLTERINMDNIDKYRIKHGMKPMDEEMRKKHLWKL